MASFDFGSFMPAFGLGMSMFGTGISTTAAYQEALAANYAAEWNATVKEGEAELALAKAGIFKELGLVERQETLDQYAEIQSAQRAQYGASGVDVNTGSALQTQAATAETGVYEAQKAQYQRDLQAWEMEAAAQSLKLEAQFSRTSKRSPWLSAATAAVGGLTSAYSLYSNWNRGSGNVSSGKVSETSSISIGK